MKRPRLAKRQQKAKAAMKAQERIDKAVGKGNAEVDAANSKSQERTSEMTEAQEKVDSLSK
jgi:hypothetical protein